MAVWPLFFNFTSLYSFQNQMAGSTGTLAGLRMLKYTCSGNPSQHKAWAVCVGVGRGYWSDIFVRLVSFQLINSDLFLKWAFLPSESIFLWKIRNRVKVLRSIHEGTYHLMTSLEYLGGPPAPCLRPFPTFSCPWGPSKPLPRPWRCCGLGQPSLLVTALFSCLSASNGCWASQVAQW